MIYVPTTVAGRELETAAEIVITFSVSMSSIIFRFLSMAVPIFSRREIKRVKAFSN